MKRVCLEKVCFGEVSGFLSSGKVKLLCNQEDYQLDCTMEITLSKKI